jgi:transposase
MDRKGEKRVLRRNLEDTRRLAVSAIEKGMHPEDAAEIYGAKRSTVYNWLKEYRERGPAAFMVKKAPGRTPALTPQQEAQLRATIIGQDPRQLQFDFAMWTRKMVGELMRRKFGIEMTPEGTGKLLHRLGLSPQRPLVRAYEQDPERVRAWKEEEYPKIHKAARAAGASIFFCDESGVRTDYHSGTTWAPVGQTPVVRGTGQRKSVNMISAVSAKGKFHFSFVEGNVSAANFIEYLKKLLDDIPGRIFLIVDGHGAHTAKATTEFAGKHSDRLKLFFLPPYSPELNPDEWVWKNIKHDNVGKIAARGVEEMRSGILRAVSRLESATQVVVGFFADPSLSYISACVQ